MARKQSGLDITHIHQALFWCSISKFSSKSLCCATLLWHSWLRGHSHHTWNQIVNSCSYLPNQWLLLTSQTRLGDFYFLTKLAKIISDILGDFWKHHFDVNCCGYILVKEWKNWATWVTLLLTYYKILWVTRFLLGQFSV